MTKETLIAKLKDLEWEDFEVKEAKADLPKSSWETVSAFANTAGGWLVFGVKELGKTFEIQGVTNAEKIEQDFLNTLRSEKFNLPIAHKQAKYDIDGKTVLAFYIPVSNKKPVYFNTPANTYIRRGSSDQKATKEEIDTMFRDQTFGWKSSEMVPNTDRSSLNEGSLRRYRDYMSRFNPDASYVQYEEELFLQKLRIIENGACTFGGLLFLGKREEIEKRFPDFRIDLLEIPGTSYNDAKFSYTFRIDEQENLWEYYFACFARLKQRIDVTFRVNAEGFGEEFSTGLNAIREALVNLLMHADYFSPAHSRIRIFSDRIEFFNPGGFPKPLAELKGKDISLPRNPIISKLFRMAKLSENAGIGLEKMESNWKAYNQTTPEYDLSFDFTITSFLTAIPSAITEEKPLESTSDLDKVLSEIKKGFGSISSRINMDPTENVAYFQDNYGLFTGYLRDKYGINIDVILDQHPDRLIWLMILIDIEPSINKQSIAKILNRSLSSIEKDFKVLRDMNLIMREGSNKVGDWRIIQQPNQ